MVHPFRVLFSILFFLSLAGCAAQQPELIFETIPPNKTTISSSRFQLIDDFNAGLTKNKVETEWAVASKEARVNLVAERSDAVKHGGSVALEYEFREPGRASMFTPLKGLDMSQATALVFMVRKVEFDLFKGKQGKLEITLGDLSGKTIHVVVDHSLQRTWNGPKDLWIQVVIPKKRFGGLNFNELNLFELSVISNSLLKPAKLVFDEIAFFGAEELTFNSQKDNLAGFPAIDVYEARRQELLSIQDDEKFLREIAHDTWRYFENLIDRETYLVVDHARVSPAHGIGSYISPTNAALYWMANVGAFDLSLISKEQAIENIKSSLDSFEKLERWNGGFWHNYYHTGHLMTTRHYISTVDNGWLAAGLVVIRSAFPEEFGERAGKILEDLDFSKFYDKTNGQLKLGFDEEQQKFSPYHYGLLVTEARVASYVAIGKGDLDVKHWARIFRTLPAEWDWQKQVPSGEETKLFNVDVFEGHYSYLNQKFVPSWGGSLFEFLSPSLILDEQKLAQKNLGRNNEVVTDLHIQYALKEQKYPIWGIAPCSVRSGKYWLYREYGIPQMGAKGYSDRGVIAPYASFLALEVRPKEAVENFRRILSQYPDSYGEYGFYDSVDVAKGIVNHQYLALDQAMSFLAMVNYLERGSIRRRFHQDPIGKAGETLFQEEQFSI